MAALDLQQLFGYIAAFSTAMAVIAIDCNSTLKRKTRRLPISVLHSPEIWILSACCGTLGAICFGFSYSPAITQVVELKWGFPPGRGLLVGVGVLAIVRSKFFNFKDTDFGGEFFYNGARAWALNGLWQRWLNVKVRCTPDAVVIAACSKPNYEVDLVSDVRERIELESDDLKKWFEVQLAALQTSRMSPGTPCNDPKSILYFRTLMKLAMDCAGPKIIPKTEVSNM